MTTTASMPDLDPLLDEVFTSTPLAFVREFLRARKKDERKIKIGTTQKEVRSNLREAISANFIGIMEVKDWLRAVEGWGRQHLYLMKVPKRSLATSHLLNQQGLRNFLKNRNLLVGAPANTKSGDVWHRVTDVIVDDELARIIWHAHAVQHERREELDSVEEFDDGEYLFKAYRLTPRRTACQLIVRKTDGVVAFMVDLPLGDEHDGLVQQVQEVAKALVVPLSPTSIPLNPIVRKLDETALSGFGPRASRGLSIGIQPTRARYRADGATVEFKSTLASSGYANSAAVREARKALRVERLIGEAGKFRLTFESKDGLKHVMVVSFDSANNRVFLFSRMSEREVLYLIDRIVAVAP